MKKLFLLITLTFIICATAMTQIVPQGMKYQAVARDLSGQVLADQEINLKITLHSDIDRQLVAYSETHDIKTNKLGLFSLVIGDGERLRGTFAEVPWSTRDIWMEVSIKEKESSDFATISNSKLLAVPYAFHAGTAAELVGQSDRGPGGVPAQVWSLFGNTDVDDTKDRLGTVNCADLVVITNDIERLRITCEGDVSIENSLHVGQDLTVDYNTYLNVDGGETVVNGDLTVDNMSSTYLTGTLDVDKATNLNSTLEVDGATDLNDDLNVDGTTDLNDDLTVTGMASTYLTGTLDVDKATNLNSTLEVDGDATFHGAVDIDGQIDASAVYISGSASLPLGGQEYVACFENTDAASVGSDGIAIKIGTTGGTSNWHDDGDNDYITFFNGQNQATGSVEGFEIGHDNPISTFPNPDFTDFFNILDFSGAFTVPSVDWGGLINFSPPSLSIDFGGVDYSFNAGGISFDFGEFDPGGFDPAAFFNPGAAGGAAQSIADIVCWGISNGMESLITTNPFDLLLAATVIAETNLCKENNGKGGVTYVSFGADYAEWLPRAQSNETMHHGQIVGVKNGKISKNTENADQILAISTNPIVLGNKPPEDKEFLYEKVGFMGQVPVLVEGKARVGDYIIPSGNNDGMGKAISSEDLTIEHIPGILGRAWSDSENDHLSYINVAVGLNRNDIATVAMKQEKQLKELQGELISMRASIQDQLLRITEKVELLENDGAPPQSFAQQK